MSVSSRSFRRSVISLLWMLSGVCVAQSNPQFSGPGVEVTGGRVASLLSGSFQKNGSQTDILYINAPVVGGTATSATAGLLLNAQGFTNLIENQITFTNVSNVTGALADFNIDGVTDFAFALSPSVSGGPDLCIYYGTNAGIGQGSAFNGGNSYPVTAGSSGCTSLRIQGTNLPNFAYIAAAPFQTGFSPNVILEDSANNEIYIVANSGGVGSNGGLPSFGIVSTIPILPTDGAGPIYIGDFNHDGYTDFIVNGQAGLSATVYFGNGNGTFQSPLRLNNIGHVYSMLVQDMDLDGIADLVVEGDEGVIEIFKGSYSTTSPFAANSEGGTQVGANGFSGTGGHLAAIGKLGVDNNLDILTTTPIGLSVLQGQGEVQGELQYALKGIYNIGPGRNSFALAGFDGDGILDLAVDSAEGVAIVQGKSDGSFVSSSAYTALLPGLGAVTGLFRTPLYNPKGNLDVVVATGGIEGQLLTGNGDGTFNLFPVATLPSGPSPVPANLWSNLFVAQFDTGNFVSGLLFSLTGLPLPAPGSSAGSGLYVENANGDGTFTGAVAVAPSSSGVPSNNNFYGESAVGDFNGDGMADIANIDGGYDDTLLKVPSGAFSVGLNTAENNSRFNQVASGFFKEGRTSRQDLIFQNGMNLVPYLNSGDGQHFSVKPPLSGTPSATSNLFDTAILLSDIDNDGCGDVVVPYHNLSANPASPSASTPNQLYIWYGNCDGTFAQTPQIITLSRNHYLAQVVDMNRDGLPDLVMSDGFVLSIFYNNGNRTYGTTAGGVTTGQDFLAGQGINSISAADLNGDGVQDLVVANGGVTISNAVVIGGLTQNSISLTPNPDVNTGGITVLLNQITTEPVTGTIFASPEPSEYQATFTLTATVTPSAGVKVLTGTVTFSIDGTPVGTAALTQGTMSSTATYVVAAGNTYLAGMHTIAASYSGDALNSTANFYGSHTIMASTTTTTLYLCVGPTMACPSSGYVLPPLANSLTMAYGQTYNGTAIVTAADGGPLPGNLLFYDLYGGTSTLLCTLVVSTGGQCPPNVGIGAQVGTHVLTAVYAGDTVHTGSTSNAVTINVLSDTTSATLTGVPNPSPFGQPVTFTVTLAGNDAPPTGTVTFLDGANPIGTATMIPSATGFISTATFSTTTLPVGVDPISVSYAGNADFGSAVSAVFDETITALPAGSFTVSVTPSPVSVGVGNGAVLTVTVAALNGFAQGVNLSCGGLPSEATCSFNTAAIAAGGGSTTLLLTTMAPHSCGSTQPYFLGGGNGLNLAPFAVPALAGLVAIFLPSRRRWLKGLLAMAVAAGAMQIVGCGNCTDLGTRPATYTIQVTGTSAGTSEVKSQLVTLNVTI